MKIKNRLVAALSAAAMLFSVSAFSVSAEKLTAEVFSANAETQWYLHENKNSTNAGVYFGDSTDMVSTASTSKNENNSGTGAKVKLEIKNEVTDASNPVQVRPVQTFTVTNGVTYTVSVDFAIAATKNTTASGTQNVAYLTVQNKPSDNSQSQSITKAIRNTRSTDLSSASGTYSFNYTPTADGTANIQLYLRHAVGTVEYSNLKVTAPVSADDSRAVAQLGNDFYTDLASAVTAASDNDTITLLKDTTLSDRITINKALTIKAENKTISGDMDKSMIIAKGGKTVSFDGVNIKNTKATTASDKRGAAAVEDNNSKLIIKNAAVTGDIYQASGKSSVELENVTADRLKTRKNIESTANNVKGNLKLTKSKISELYFVYNNDTVSADAETTIATLTVTDVTEGAKVVTGTPKVTTANIGNGLKLETVDGKLVAKTATVTPVEPTVQKVTATALSGNGSFTDGSIGYTANVVPGADKSVKLTNVKWVITNNADKTATVDATVESTEISGASTFTYGLVIEKDALGENQVKAVSFNYTEGGNQ